MAPACGCASSIGEDMVFATASELPAGYSLANLLLWSLMGGFVASSTLWCGNQDSVGMNDADGDNQPGFEVLKTLTS